MFWKHFYVFRSYKNVFWKYTTTFCKHAFLLGKHANAFQNRSNAIWRHTNIFGKHTNAFGIYMIIVIYRPIIWKENIRQVWRSMICVSICILVCVSDSFEKLFVLCKKCKVLENIRDSLLRVTNRCIKVTSKLILPSVSSFKFCPIIRVERFVSKYVSDYPDPFSIIINWAVHFESFMNFSCLISI